MSRNPVNLAERRAAKRKAEIETGKIFAMPGGHILHLYQDDPRGWSVDHCDKDDNWNARLGTYPTWRAAMLAAMDVQAAAQAVEQAGRQ
jgi:hypothetical protein